MFFCCRREVRPDLGECPFLSAAEPNARSVTG
jgi:hypothetical protein